MVIAATTKNHETWRAIVQEGNGEDLIAANCTFLFYIGRDVPKKKGFWECVALFCLASTFI